MTQELQLLMITDARPGHRRQLQALSEALSRLRPVNAEYRDPLRWRDQLRVLSGRNPDSSRTHPDLIIGAGHATHTTVLSLGRATGAATAVLMRPSLPTGLFDLCLIPDHDRVAASSRIIITEGVLSPVRPAARTDLEETGEATALIGGPVRSHRWDSEQVWAGLLCWAGDSEAPIQIVTSRRTPEDFATAVPDALQSRIVWPDTHRHPGWLQHHLPVARRLAVTADSLSMQADALASGRPAELISAGISLPDRHRHAAALFQQRVEQPRAAGSAADHAAAAVLEWCEDHGIGNG